VWPAKWRCGRLGAFTALGFAAAALVIAARAQGETQTFMGRLAPAVEALQRMRASYVYVSTWPWQTIAHHVAVFAVLLAAFARVRKSMGVEARAFLIGLPVVGLLSMPLSWLLLEQGKWGIVPQIQPMRTLLFLTLAMQFLTATAGVRARGRAEAAMWFALAVLPSMAQPLEMKWIALAAALGAAMALAGRATPAVAAAAFFVLPLAGVVNYPKLHTPELAQLSAWARANTPKDAVFQFADAGRGLEPGIFRTGALRAIYCDWKGGGQVNYLNGFGEQWWFRWQQTYKRPVDLARYGALGVRYVVLRKEHRMNASAVYENGAYLVYRTP